MTGCLDAIVCQAAISWDTEWAHFQYICSIEIVYIYVIQYNNAWSEHTTLQFTDIPLQLRVQKWYGSFALVNVKDISKGKGKVGVGRLFADFLFSYSMHQIKIPTAPALCWSILNHEKGCIVILQEQVFEQDFASGKNLFLWDSFPHRNKNKFLYVHNR